MLERPKNWTATEGKRGRKGARSGLVDAIRTKLVIQTRAADLEQFGRFCPVAAGLLERVDNAGSLGLGHRATCRRTQVFLIVLGVRYDKIVTRDRRTGGRDDGPLDVV